MAIWKMWKFAIESTWPEDFSITGISLNLVDS